MKIAVLASGGVDSSVVLAMLKEQGHEVYAYYLKIWVEDDLAFLGNCPWEEDLAFVREVCAQYDVPLRIINLQREYKEHVISYFLEELKRGRTPSPDLFCNQLIKFGAFFKAVEQEGFEKIATGHYAQLEEKEGKFFLSKGKDLVKDQTYFLSFLSQAQLSKLLFPLGALEKKEVREFAVSRKLMNASRKDSQGICFLGNVSYDEFIKSYLGERAGEIREKKTGKVLGSHQGYWLFTLGQRRGLSLPGGPWYVQSKDIEKNIVYIAHGEEERNDNQYFLADRLNWILEPPKGFSRLTIKLRHGAQVYPCSLALLDGDRAFIEIDQEIVYSITPGQCVVFYQENLCLGAGIVSLAFHTH